ncbi:unnamed protein product (macronuclear) [Paramecium tetraurelia]|uniref:Uncharacterized protein n=1 Tax=Paramecium tetraurelia TaxID=5888 RepID=A0BXB0_PARTE|nr:uncharacterized protein GSPATT00033030001 [Paramecium tetraurelia]CAK63177.1 unnamed protein product [Paramecium tetraurelia]|eukprot:XP_001430575.1 hypothetical protein (macronuclear) [Paramecium tetraurelia strain d4-2]
MQKLLALILTLSIVYSIDPSMVQLSTEKMDELSQSNLGKFILEMAQTHAEMRGPLDDLVTAIGDLENELTAELQQLEDDFTRSTNQHQVTQENLDINIGQTEINIFNEKDFIDAILLPSIDQTNAKIERLNGFMNDNRDALSRETLARQNQHQAYLDRVSEHQGAISAVDEALQLINSLINGNVAFSEKATIHQAVKRVNSKIQKTSTIHPLVEALLQLTQNFADQGQAQKIRDLLQDTRNQLVSSLNQENTDEQQIQETWEARQKTLNTEYQEFKRSVLEATYVLAAYQNKLKSTQEALTQNELDLQNYNDSLQQDKDAQAQEIQIYNELKAQYQIQLQTTRNAKEFVNSAEFSTVIRNKLNSGGI